ncbi:MAG TPA: hypothetical protein VG818_03285 [Gemmatimonadaceae bacterium]|jgi:hypothetical protein|nr:hypothetical protein [Gemmatimonadaceae bacterium]
MAATAHGSALPDPSDAGAVAPTAVPQRWQNFAPGESGVRQEAQAAPASGAPQLEQNFPDAAVEAPQRGQVAAEEDSVMQGNLAAARAVGSLGGATPL